MHTLFSSLPLSPQTPLLPSWNGSPPRQLRSTAGAKRRSTWSSWPYSVSFLFRSRFYILHGLFLPWFSIHNHLAWTFSHFIASLSGRACIASSARVFPFLFIRGATCTMITILYRPSFFAFFYMYFHYRLRLFVPWRDSRRVTRG